MKKISMICSLSGLLLFGGVNSFSSETVQPPEGIANQSAAINQAKQLDTDVVITEANNAYINKDYKRAKDLYLKAISNLSSSPGSNTPGVQKKILDLTESLSNVYNAWSLELLEKAKQDSNPEQIEQSIALCKEAKEMNPQCSELADKLISYYTENKKIMEYNKSVSTEKLLPDNASKVQSIDVLYEQGKTLFNNKMYNQAKDKFDEILFLDPYNTNALEYIRQINIKIVAAGDYKTQVTATERAAEIEWEKLSPIMSRTLSGERVDLLESDSSGRKDSANSLKEKIKNIIISNISFEQVPIDTAMAFLRNESQKADPSGKGVNIFLKLEPLASAAQPQKGNNDAKQQKPQASGGNSGEGWSENGNEKTQDTENLANQYLVTMTLENVPLDKALDYITKSAGLNYKIDKYAVVVYSPNVQETNMATEVIPVEREVFMDVSPDNKTVNLKQYFQDRGVIFPENSTCVYDPKISRMIIRNSPAEIDKIRNILNNLENTLPQVSIAARFVEMSQQDYQELGFEWQVSKSSGNGTMSENNQVNRFANEGGVLTQNGIPDKEFGMLYQSNGISVEGTMHALSQDQKTQILSAPRVTTLSGQRATIRMITDRYFPTNWTQPTVTLTQTQTSTSSSTTQTVIPATPQVSMDNPTPIGIRLDVTPQVSSDNYTIDMVLQPTVQDFVGWTEYAYQSSDTAISDAPIEMPEISARTVQTQVRTYDGETVIMGGVYKDETQSINDNVPILEDIPLVGRLFQSQIEAPNKTNLLIFTTVQLIRPDGTPLRPSRSAGLPTFRD